MSRGSCLLLRKLEPLWDGSAYVEENRKQRRDGVRQMTYAIWGGYNTHREPFAAGKRRKKKGPIKS